MTLRQLYIIFWLSIFVLFVNSCKKETPESEPISIAFLQADTPLADSLFLKKSNAQLADLIMWIDPDDLTDSLLNNDSDLQFGGLVYDLYQEPSKISYSDKGLLNIHHHIQQASILSPWASEKALLTVRNDSLRKRYQQIKNSLLTSSGTQIDLDRSIDLQAEDSSTIADQLAPLLKALDRNYPHRLIHSLGGLEGVWQPYDSDQKRTEALKKNLIPVVEKGLALITLKESRLNDLQIENPLDSIIPVLRDSLRFQGLISLELDACQHPDPEHLEAFLESGVNVFRIYDEVTDYRDLLRKLIRKNKKIRDQAQNSVHLAMKAAEWGWVLDPKSQTALRPEVYRDNIGEKLVHRGISEQSIILVNDAQKAVPVENRYLQNCYLMTVGAYRPAEFINSFREYASPAVFHYRDMEEADPGRMDRSNYKYLVFGIYNTLLDPVSHQKIIQELNHLSSTKKVLVLNFGYPENLGHFEPTVSLMQATDPTIESEKLAAQALFGGRSIQGKWPYTHVEGIPYLAGTERMNTVRFAYSLPEEAGIDANFAHLIDSLVWEGINYGAMPGCQIFVAKGGKVILDKSYGYHTYGRVQRVKDYDLYDLASVSKAAGTTLSAMLLYDEGKFQLQDSLRKHLRLPDESTIKNIKITDLFTHRSGLQPNMPILPFIVYRNKEIARYDKYFCWDDQQDFQIEVAADFYLEKEYSDSMWQKVCTLPVDTSGHYLYSDVNFNLIQKIIEEKARTELDLFLYQEIYNKLGLNHLRYRPLESFDAMQIVPTENDEFWRHQLLQGFVHDESAALLGGVAGNAGLFGNAQDLATLFEMLRRGGQYGGKQVISASSVGLFTQTVPGTSRGLGFDKQKTSGTAGCSPNASMETFGHTGFTGTCVWVDPKTDLVFVFLSNRVHPSRKQKGLYTLAVREKIHQVVYDHLNTYPKKVYEGKPDRGLSMGN